MITRRSFVLASVALAVAAFTASSLVGWHLHSSQPQRSAAAWVHSFSTPAQMVAATDVVALVQAGDTRLSRIADSDADSRGATSDSLPFEVSELTVVRALKGTVAGSTLPVERAGGTTESGEAVYLDHDGGAFEPGHTYLVFLKQQEDGPFYYQINDQGRYVLDAGRLRAAVDPGAPVARFFHGRTVDEVAAMIAAPAADTGSR